MKSIAQRIAWVIFAIIFAGMYVYTGNPIISEIADYGSAGIQSTDPCNHPDIFC